MRGPLEEPTRFVVAAACHGSPEARVSDEALGLSRPLVRRHLVERLLPRTHATRFPATAHRWLNLLSHDFHDTLMEVAGHLHCLGVHGVLIKSGLEKRAAASTCGTSGFPAAEYGNVDLVVGADAWGAALRALEGWGTGQRRQALEPHKLIVRRERGLAFHLHRDVEWFGVPTVPALELRARAEPVQERPGLPSRADSLLLWIAHALFQTLSLDLAELREVRKLARPDTVAAAGELAAREGWGPAFTSVAAEACRIVAELDAGAVPALQERLPALPTLLEGWRHDGRLLSGGRWRPALREIALSPALVAAKRGRGPW